MDSTRQAGLESEQSDWRRDLLEKLHIELKQWSAEASSSRHNRAFPHSISKVSHSLQVP